MIATQLAAERMPVVAPDVDESSPNETWKMHGEGCYGPSAQFALDKLGSGSGKKKCLVIGSPLPEIRALSSNGWRVSHVDVRTPPEETGDFVLCDATELVYPSETFEAVSSTCVLCHAGLGRYGDPIKPNGDVLMLKEIARVLKPGGLAAITAGPSIDWLATSIIYGNVHRIYTLNDLKEMVRDAGLEFIGYQSIVSDHKALDEYENYVYLSMLLKKPEGVK